jgi:hypothetical protein
VRAQTPEDRERRGVEPEVVDGQPRQRAQPLLQPRELGAARVDLGVPAGERVHAPGERVVERAAAVEVEAHGAHARGVQREDLLVALLA